MFREWLRISRILLLRKSSVGTFWYFGGKIDWVKSLDRTIDALKLLNAMQVSYFDFSYRNGKQPAACSEAAQAKRQSLIKKPCLSACLRLSPPVQIVPRGFSASLPLPLFTALSIETRCVHALHWLTRAENDCDCACACRLEGNSTKDQLELRSTALHALRTDIGSIFVRWTKYIGNRSQKLNHSYDKAS